MSMTPKELIIVGNGYDIHCGLNSKFKQYFDNCCKEKIQSFLEYIMSPNKKYQFSNDVNIWSIAMFIQYYLDDTARLRGRYAWLYNQNFGNECQNWFNVEYLIYQLLTNTIDGRKSLKDYISAGIDARMDLAKYGAPRSETKGDIYANPYQAYVWFNPIIKEDPNEYLQEELAKFERSFNSYLKQIVDEDDYTKKSSTFFNKLRMLGYDSIVINFNYTKIKNDYINNQINVHGSIEDRDIIIGIDAEGANRELIQFTKTYRNLKRLRSAFGFPEGIIHMSFYGHSLAEADFSYFYSMFEMYKLYDSKLTLVFYYSKYGETEEEEQENINKYTQSVCNLINTYATKAHNEQNLLHRLLLEGRILIKEVEEG